MAGKSRRSKLILSDEDRAELEQLSRSRTLPRMRRHNAPPSFPTQGYYGGESIASIGETSGDDAPERFEMGCKALWRGGSDGGAKERSPSPQGTGHWGRFQSVGSFIWRARNRKDLGYAAEVWSRQALARHVREHAVEVAFPAASPCWSGQSNRASNSGGTTPLHPEKVKYYLERRDPDFEGGVKLGS